jgi:hypothetical protein
MSAHRKFNELFQSFRNYNSYSRSDQHLHEMGKSFGPVEEIMNISHIVKKENHMNTLEKHHVYCALL